MSDVILVVGLSGVGKSTIFGETIRRSNEDYKHVNYGDRMLEIAETEGLVEHRDALQTLDAETQGRYLRYAGADTILSPKHRLGKSLADKARNLISADLDRSDALNDDFGIVEFPVHGESELCGKTLSECQVLEQTGAKLIGAWIRGEFVTSFSADTYIDQNTVLVLAGTTSQLEDVQARIRTHEYHSTEGPIVIAGHGLVGMTAEGILDKAGLPTIVIDRDADENVDTVGDATEEATLHDAGLNDADTLIVALSDDEDTILTTLVARNIDPDIEILVAANTSTITNELHTAGADYVLALPKMSARMVTLSLFDEDVMTLGEQIQLVHMDAPGFVGTTPEEADVRERTNCVIVTIERNGNLVTDIETTEIRNDDRVLIAGAKKDIQIFATEFGD